MPRYEKIGKLEKKPRKINWVGMVSTTVEPAKIVDIKHGMIERGVSMDEVQVHFASERTVEYVKNRLE